ncbi:MAG TPA: hypothetical protein VF202_00100 [Trueperaceae bacterium]
MLRMALIAMVVVVAGLLALALLDDAQVEAPEAVITLRDTQVTLYPRADPEAVWYFSAPRVEYVPDDQEATLFAIEDGRRTVGGETDFTLASERVTIDDDDNIRGEAMHAHLVEDEIDLHMEAKGSRLVLIDQARGRFEVPRAAMSGPDLGESVFEDMRISFDFTDFEAGGPGTVGYSEFIVRSSDDEP